MAKAFEDFKKQLTDFIAAVKGCVGADNAKQKTLALLEPLDSLFGNEGLQISLSSMGQAKAIGQTIVDLLQMPIENKETADFIKFVLEYLNNAEKFKIPPLGTKMGYNLDEIVGGKIDNLKKGLDLKLNAWEEAEKIKGNESALQEEAKKNEDKLQVYIDHLDSISSHLETQQFDKLKMATLYGLITGVSEFFESSVRTLSAYENLLNAQLRIDAEKIKKTEEALEKFKTHELSQYDESMAQALGLSDVEKLLWKGTFATKDTWTEYLTSMASTFAQAVKDTTVAAATSVWGTLVSTAKGLWDRAIGNPVEEASPGTSSVPVDEKTPVQKFKEDIITSVEKRIASMQQEKLEKEGKLKEIVELKKPLAEHAGLAKELKFDIEQQKDKSQILLKLKQFVQKTKAVAKKVGVAIRKSMNKHVIELSDLALDQADKVGKEAENNFNASEQVKTSALIDAHVQLPTKSA